METNTLKFDHPLGSFKKSIRAYREYKKQWREQMEVKLAKMEEEIQNAKLDQFFKLDTI